jgi:glycosyltransferase involved in cell wall biosynthesis
MTNLPSPYIVDYLNLLSRKINLLCFFELDKSYDINRRWSQQIERIKFDYAIFKGLKYANDYSFVPGVIKILFQGYKSIIITNPMSATGIFSIALLKMKKINYSIESEGGFVKKNNFIINSLKRFVVVNAEFCFSSNPTGDNYFIYYGANPFNIKRVPFSSIFSNDIVKNRPYYKNRFELRKQYGIDAKFSCIAIGRYVETKNFEWLIENWSKMSQDSHLFIVGEGNLKSRYEMLIKAQKLSNVHLIEYLERVELLNFIDNFDLLIHPTLSDVWGLVINEAMARGVPVITTPLCLSSEVMICRNFDGFIENLGTEFFEKVISLSMDLEHLDQVGLRALLKANMFSLEQVVDSHVEYFVKEFGIEVFDANR